MITLATQPSAIKVLSIDGGGTRGIIPAKVLEEIEARTGKYIFELFDVITGTSTGGLIASALVKPGLDLKPQYTAKDLVDLYLNNAKQIFTPSILRKFLTGFGLWGSKYNRTAYNSMLLQTFGSTLLSEALCPIFIPIFSIDNDKPFIASSFFAKQTKENDFYLKDIVAATSAAPTYFAPVTFKSVNGSTSYTGADGGIYANNPELIGITGVYIMHPGLKVQNIVLVSIGTGDAISSNASTVTDSSDNGDIGWLKNRDIIGNMIDAESAFAEAAITSMLKQGNYYRFQFDLTQNLLVIDDSDHKNLEALVTIAENFINKNNEHITTLCNMLCE